MPPPRTGNETFTHGVFLSHSLKDKAVVRPLAERLRKDGLKVWFDEWEIAKAESGKGASELQPSAFSLQPLLEHGLERSRVLVLCMSANAFGSDWAQLRLTPSQPSTLNYQPTGAPLNQERRFLPLRLNGASCSSRTMKQVVMGNRVTRRRRFLLP